MTASEGSFLGLAKQTAKGSENSTDAEFKYLLFSEGASGVDNRVIPLDQEVGGGPMLRDIQKVGAMAFGQYTIIPRPTILGDFLMGLLGKDTSVQQALTDAYKHTFEPATDPFSIPYYTVRSSPGGAWGEKFVDSRIASMALSWRAPDYIRGSVAFMGITPTTQVSMATWAASSKVDGGPQFLTCNSDIELPLAADIKVLSGSVAIGLNIPLEEQWIVGSYFPEDLDMNSRFVSVTFGVKVTSASLYDQMTYDPAGGAAWAAQMLREASFKILFASPTLADVGYPYSLEIKGNAQTEAGGDANVVWSMSPIALRAGRQVTATITGTFLANPSTYLGANPPIQIELINKQVAAY